MLDSSTPPVVAADRAAQVTDNVMRIATGFATSQALFTADALNVFNQIDEGTSELDELSEATGIAAGPLERLLIVCCTAGLLVREGSNFKLTEISSACLLKGQPGYVGGLFSFFARGIYPIFKHLGSGLHESQPQWSKARQIGESGQFEAVYRDENALRRFHAAMDQLSYPTALAAVDQFDFSPFGYIVDVGGGTGAFLSGLCERLTSLRGAVFDLPQVEALALEKLAERGHSDRIDFIPGNFFEDELPENADLFILGDILHDWSEDDGTRILQKIHSALPDHGAVCIVENLFNDTKDGPHLTAIVNLIMLVATHGEQHTPKEFNKWLKRTGFSRIEAHFLPAPRGVVIAWKT